MSRASSRSRILSAALRVLASAGALNLTLEAVSREAGVSKGGLLYHFPSKEALISGLLEAVNLDFEEALRRELSREPEAPGSFLRAYIRASFAYEQGLFPLVAGLLAAASSQPQLLEPFRKAFQSWQDRLEHDGLPPERATLVRLAVDGLWFADLFGLASPQGASREALAEALVEMTR